MSEEPEKKEENGQEEKNSALAVNKLLQSRSVIISGEINQALAEKVTAQLLVLQEMGDEPIKLFINSQGGHVEAGDTIHDMIKFVKPKVLVIGTGWVASAGITIFLAADKENRYTLPNTRFMIHQPLGGVRGKVSDIEIEAKELLRARERINQLISKATGQPLEKVEKDTDSNYWMSPEQAIDYGIATHVISQWDELKA
ncbi:ATP-dependent Clp protease proteolytic subunit [Erwinia amylovora]|uniref:ATP-dependent Clp protease proteolytic subunit n=4 Tax=Erwinia amylovora TaxID=552 RepID=A0A831A211_ERWAM|nr:ATP-dependent Clp protease proteolytic subunit [Erwinia amylovora]CBX79832.1 putative ATP-dependent Clp protease, proteolytic subunit ClpP2 [Erwinia amylovora ATCC BAA-2158]CDK14547.1 putative ATP-dependent Clp protease, proteolytic subunit ClpP2 [Erwinia amylovora LA635]CDK17914.1 putative ATP-dependent Clp protease, proteolytic subunit ClpP2 [Erwinia amylovora LA636]CDK21283.1 putative ATP-dependent Clp protease, proteolytic subunit ClpP2 [Erwinia amylovora LA637]ATZ10881.1 ATP-dependent 